MGEEYATDLVERCHALRRKPLLILDDDEIALALRQRIGLTWVRDPVLIRLRQDPLRFGSSSFPGDLLSAALRLPWAEWRALATDVEEVAAAIVPTLPEDEEWQGVIAAFREFTTSA